MKRYKIKTIILKSTRMQNDWKKRRILSIDGGGIKGIYAAQILADIEKDYGISICDYFDIITGTSTGAIIAAALARRIPAQTIVDLYRENGKYIFHGYHPNKVSQLVLLVKMLLDYKYRNEHLKECLKKQFGEDKMEYCETRLLIPAYELNDGHVQIFKTPHHKEYRRDYKLNIVDILMCTTAAPTYFPPYEFQENGRYVDGGIGAINPTYIGVVEAITRCGWKSEDLYVLSIGCTDSNKQFSSKKKVNGIHVLDIIDFLMRAESQYSENISKILLKNPQTRYLRINHHVDSKKFKMDAVTSDTIAKLVECAHRDSKMYTNQIKNMFFLHEMKEPYEPIYRCK